MTPEPLNYQGVEVEAPSPQKSAARAALWTGVPDVLIGVSCLVASALMLQMPDERANGIIWIIISVFGILFGVCGVLYIVAAGPIRNGSPVWHRNVIRIASVQIACLYVWFLLLGFNTRNVVSSIVISLVFAGLLTVGHFRMIKSVKKSWSELKPATE